MKDKLLKTGSFIVSLGLSLAVLGVIFYLWLPIARWYYGELPAWGIDLFNSVSYVSYLLKYFVLRVSGWKYTWFEGQPFALDYQSFFFYLMLPFAKYFGPVRGIQVFALASNFALIVFSYFLFLELSKNRVLSGVLTLATAFSVNIYRSLVWAGGIPFFAAQAVFPLVLWLVVKETKERHRRWVNRRYLVLAAIVSGLGLMGHPQPFITFVFPSVAILLLISSYPGLRFLSTQKIKDLVVYFGVAILVGLPGLYHLIFSNFLVRFASIFNVNLLGIAPPSPVESRLATPGVAEWARNQFYVSFTGTNQAILHLLGVTFIVFIVGIIIRKKRIRAIINTLALALIAGWSLFYIYLLSQGIDIYHGGLDAWYKLFWVTPIVLGALSSQFWSVFATGIVTRIRGSKKKIVVRTTLEVASGVILIVLTLVTFSPYTKGIISKIEQAGALSSAFPAKLDVRITEEGFEEIKKEIKPSFITDSPTDLRLYSNEQTFNLWWNVLFATPLARGYIDTPGTIAERWGVFWMDSAFGMGSEGGTSLGDDWNTPEEVVERNIEFLLDWYAVGYLEGNHQSRGGTGALASLLTSDKFVEEEEVKEVQGAFVHGYADDPNEASWVEEATRLIPFYKIRKDLTSPIHLATNAPRVLLVGGGDSFDIVTRFLGMMAYPSDKVIVIKGPVFIDDVSLNQMGDFDAVILYKYDYKNYSKAWDRIKKYIDSGGKVFVDTGVEVKESSSVDLPDRFPTILADVFPIEKTKRGDLGRLWKKDIKDRQLVKGVETSEFSDFVFDENPWNISYPPDKEGDLRKGAEVLLSSNGFPVIVEQKIGEGKIIWSGLNLPYHVLYNYNFEEGKLLLNTFERLIDFGSDELAYEVNWISPSKREITTTGATGVLIKEKAYSGWKAKIKSGSAGEKLTIYEAGPSTPGFLYVSIPEAFKDRESTVTFSYVGALDSWLANIVSVFALILGIDYVFLKSKIFGRFLGGIRSMATKKTRSWWREEEY